MRRFLVLAIVVVAGATAAYHYWRTQTGEEAPQYRLARVEKGAIEMTVSATGQVNPVTTVQVGSQVSGQIAELLADFNTEVTAGQVIARIDPQSFEARLAAARADLAFAGANLAVQQAALAEHRADIAGAQAALKDAAAEHARQGILLGRRVVSQSAVDRALATRDQARARKLSAEAKLAKQQAQIGSARAQVQSRRAALNERRLDLERTVIRSPVAGVVIGRNVELGQTVAASLQAPVLFTIAEDLKRMQVEVSVDEADIGRLRERQRVRFTVDAYARRNFTGQVRQIRKAPNVVSNVVTYTVIVGAENPDLALLPGMTANVEVIVGARKDVLKVPSAALRFRPKAGAAASQASSGGGGGGGRREAARARGRALFQRLNKTLGLNEEQQSVIGAIFRETGQAIGALRQAGGQPETMRQAVRGLRAQASRRIAALLDDEQKRRYAEMLAEAAVTTSRGQVWRLGPNGQPLAIPVVSGISDSSMTEIVRGELKAGQPVIVGRAFGSGR